MAYVLASLVALFSALVLVAPQWAAAMSAFEQVTRALGGGA